MPGPLPKPANQRQRRNTPTYAPTALPADGRPGDPPPLPPLKVWQPATITAWSELWRKPQAVLWDQTGATLHRWALLYDLLVIDTAAPASVHAQLLQLEDRHGLSPVAMAKLRWAIAPAEPAPPSDIAAPKAKADRRARILDVVAQ